MAACRTSSKEYSERIRDYQRLFGDSPPLAERLTTIQETFPDLAPSAPSRA